MTTDVILRPAVFIDANALQYMSSYLRYAEKLHLPPYDGEPREYADVQNTLGSHLPKKICEYVMNGCRMLAFLQKNVSNHESEATFYASWFSKAELLHGILDGQAHARLAHEGFSYRMRQRAGELSHLVSMYLQREDYERSIREVDELYDILEARGRIRIKLAEDEIRDFPSIAIFSTILQGNIFLDVLDCWLYGCAVLLQTDEFITCDRYLKRAINLIHNPSGKPEWQELRSKIEGELKRLLPVQTSIGFILPKVPTIPSAVPQPWEENDA